MRATQSWGTLPELSRLWEMLAPRTEPCAHVLGRGLTARCDGGDSGQYGGPAGVEELGRALHAEGPAGAMILSERVRWVGRALTREHVLEKNLTLVTHLCLF